MKNRMFLLSILVGIGILSGCQNSSTPREEQIASPSMTSTSKSMNSDQSTATGSSQIGDDIDIPKGVLSEDDPIFDSGEENTFIGEVLQGVESGHETALVKVKISDLFQKFYIHTDDREKLKQGQVIRIKTNGVILETFPASFAEVFSVEVIE